MLPPDILTESAVAYHVTRNCLIFAHLLWLPHCSSFFFSSDPIPRPITSAPCPFCLFFAQGFILTHPSERCRHVSTILPKNWCLYILLHCFCPSSLSFFLSLFLSFFLSFFDSFNPKLYPSFSFVSPQLSFCSRFRRRGDSVFSFGAPYTLQFSPIMTSNAFNACDELRCNLLHTFMLHLILMKCWLSSPLSPYIYIYIYIYTRLLLYG